jgi:quinol monooxygenase YgiN
MRGIALASLLGAATPSTRASLLCAEPDLLVRHTPLSRRLPPPTCLANAVTNGLVGSICLNVKLCIKPERRDEFVACIRNNQEGTLRTEALAIEYVWGEDTENANTFHFYEKYHGRAGFEAHQATPHFAAWEDFAASDPFTAPPVVHFYEEM